jgi:Zn-dependent peptidase ImmA (M78 family)
MSAMMGTLAEARAAPLKKALLRELADAKRTQNLFHWLQRETARLAERAYNGTYVELNRSILQYFNVSEIKIVDRNRKTGAAKREVGGLRAAGTGYFVEVSNSLSLSDRRFVVAHELGHIFWLKTGSLEPLSRQQSRFIDPDIEYLCDLTAAYLLCPDFLLDPGRFQNGRFGVELAYTAHVISESFRLSKNLKVPFSVMLQRIFEGAHQRVHSLVTFRVERQQEQLSLFEPDHRRRIRLRDIYLRLHDECTESAVVFRRNKNVSAVTNRERENALNMFGPIEDFFKVFRIPETRKYTFGSYRQGPLQGSYYKLPNYIVLMFCSSA